MPTPSQHTAIDANSTEANAVALRPSTHEVKEFRKANQSIGLRVVEGSLTLLNRKIFNVLVYHAQKLGKLGQNAPIDTPPNQKYFWVPLSDLAKDASYDSKDMKFLRASITSMQDIKLCLDGETEWIAERLIASVKFVNPKGLHSRSGQVWVGFSFPPEVYENVMDPQMYTRLSIFYAGMLRGGPSLALYEICRRYATNPSRVTSVETYMHWYGALTGNPVPASVDLLPPYKYFKRDVLKPAIAEVNKNTDIQVELIEHKQGRRVGSLQFRVNLSAQTQSELPAPKVIDVSLLERLMRLGINQHEATDILAKHNEDKLDTALRVVEARDQARGGKPIESKPAYFRWALKEGVQPAPVKPQPQLASETKPAPPTLLERFIAARGKAAVELFAEMDEAQRADVYDQFKEQSSTRVVPLEKLAGNATSRTAFGLWYAQTLWGEPGARDLSYFADTQKIPFGGEAG